MCDTFVADSSVTKDGSVILGKNSDRQPNEPQEVRHFPGGKTDSDTLQCTYISIPQVQEIYSIVVSKPNWMYGAEMGTNEHGVAIGNEAIWTIFDRDNREERLLGMDMLRVALERSQTAEEALDIIVDLLQTYGQGGNCGFDHDEFYDNSFIIADPTEAWVLETAGRFWIAEKVNGIRSISNTLTIETEYDRIHPELLQYAINHGLCKDEEDFNFKQQFSDKYNITRIGAKGDLRRACTYNALSQYAGQIEVGHAMETLRDHNTENNDPFYPRKGSMTSPCLHASSMLTPSQSTASMVAHLGERSTVWMTGTAAPCLSLFKPMDPRIATGLPALPDTYHPDHLWWEHEKLHRLTLRNYPTCSAYYVDKLRSFESNLLQKWMAADQLDTMERIAKDSFAWHLESVKEWADELQSLDLSGSIFDWRYNRFWERLNHKAELQL